MIFPNKCKLTSASSLRFVVRWKNDFLSAAIQVPIQTTAAPISLKEKI